MLSHLSGIGVVLLGQAEVLRDGWQINLEGSNSTLLSSKGEGRDGSKGQTCYSKDLQEVLAAGGLVDWGEE